jgi:hypothetical protein
MAQQRAVEPLMNVGMKGSPRRRWVDDIKMDLRKRGRVGVDWIHLAQDKGQWTVLVNIVMNLRFP